MNQLLVKNKLNTGLSGGKCCQSAGNIQALEVESNNRSIVVKKGIKKPIDDGTVFALYLELTVMRFENV